MIEFAGKDRELVTLASDSHLCHLAHCVKFSIDITLAYFDCFRSVLHFCRKRFAYGLCFFKFLEVTGQFLVVFLQGTKFFLDFCKEFFLHV